MPSWCWASSTSWGTSLFPNRRHVHWERAEYGSTTNQADAPGAWERRLRFCPATGNGRPAISPLCCVCCVAIAVQCCARSHAQHGFVQCCAVLVVLVLPPVSSSRVLRKLSSHEDDAAFVGSKNEPEPDVNEIPVHGANCARLQAQAQDQPQPQTQGVTTSSLAAWPGLASTRPLTWVGGRQG